MDKTRESEDLVRMLRLETDLGRYQTFVINAGKVSKGYLYIHVSDDLIFEVNLCVIG